MRILAIDPGNIMSAFVVLETKTFGLEDFGLTENEKLVDLILRGRFDTRHLIVERIKSYGMAMGDSLLDTCIWTGRFMQAYGAEDTTLVPRKTVVAHICKNATARDKNVRQALIDFYPQTGGGKNPSIGTAKDPGPLYGVKKDVWAALAVGVWYVDTYPGFLA